MTTRLHRFDALDNFRDFGDYDTSSGRRVRSGVLFRSAHHAKLSDADVARVAALGIRTVVDLRRPVERDRQPSRRFDGFDGTVIQSDMNPEGEAPHITFLKTADLTPASSRQFMADTYRRLPFEASHVDLFTRYFARLAQSDAPVLIHCAAGKDRTGLLAALTHHLLGVGRDDLYADFLLTNVAVDLDARAPAIAEQLKAMTGRTPSHEAVVAFMGVEAAYLDMAFAAMNERFGSVDGYLAGALGVDPDRRDRIVGHLTR